jgi:hypothetical protein
LIRRDDEGADEEGLITDNRKLNDMIKMQWLKDNNNYIF